MIIDNFEQVSKLLEFDNKDDFYFLQIIQRKKDGCDVYDSGSNGYRRVKTYYIRSVEDLMKRKDKIIELCENNNARAYIHLNVRSAKDVAMEAAKKYIDLIKEDRCEQGHRVYDHCCGVTPKVGVKKKWIVDVDGVGPSVLKEICKRINRCRSRWPIDNGINPPVEYDNVICIIPTVHGVHIITHGFDAEHFKTTLFNERAAIGLGLDASQVLEIGDIKKDGPTLLYFNKPDEKKD